VEEHNAYRNIDKKVGVYHPNNRPVRQLSRSLFRCPSSGATGTGYSDYAGVHSDWEVPIDVDNNGVFFLNSRLRHKDIADGLSNTLFIGEKFTLSGDLGWMSGTRATLRNVGIPLNITANRLWARSPPPGIANPVVPTPLDGEDLISALFGDLTVNPFRFSGQGSLDGPVADEDLPDFVRPTDAQLAVAVSAAPIPVEPSSHSEMAASVSCRELAIRERYSKWPIGPIWK
jgi:hypothetical protein